MCLHMKEEDIVMKTGKREVVCAREITRSKVFVGMKATLSRLCMRDSEQKRVRERNGERDSTANVCAVCRESVCMRVRLVFTDS